MSRDVCSERLLGTSCAGSAHLCVVTEPDTAQSWESDLCEVAALDSVEFLPSSISAPLCQRPSPLPGKIDQV